jgi:uncharacterized protein with HEPN domain
MSRHDLRLTIEQMLAHCREALDIVGTRRREDLESDRLFELAMARLLEIIGEAAGRVPHDLQAEHDEIPWHAIIGLRNRLIHGYDAVDLDIVWQVLAQDLPALVVSLEQLLLTEAW